MKSSRKAVVLLGAAVGLAVLAALAYFANRGALPKFGAPSVPAGQTGTLGQGGMGGMSGMSGMSGMGGGPPGGMAVGVEAVNVEVGRIVEDVAAVGTLRANESVVLRPEIAGRIARIEFKEGVPVAKGALLIALDASTQAADLQQAQANLALARSSFERTEDLFRKKFVSASAQDQAAANLKVQEATTAQAQARLAKTRIVAPFAGVIGIRKVSVGDYVKEGQDLVNLEDMSTLKLDFKLPEAYLPRIGRGQNAELTTDARPGETFTAVVDAIDPLIDTAGRAIAVRARLANPDGRLRPGMFARVRLIFGEREGVLMVPEEALVPAGSDQFVFRVVDGKAQRVKVKTGARRGTRVEVAEGLAAGDMIVTAGQLKIRDGAPVKTVAPAGVQPQQAAAQKR